MNLRKEARGRPCMVRLPGCDGGGETTVLAHYRLSGYCGTGMKPDDLAFGAWACGPCHDLVDGRRYQNYGPSSDHMAIAHAEGVMRTIAELRKEGKV
jgi:hypothetical protein